MAVQQQLLPGPDGKWTVPNPGDLTDGQTVTATATDPARQPVITWFSSSRCSCTNSRCNDSIDQ
ncbi:hypothetical protein IC784_04160 [Acinetobacter seifertii]|nr:hypothetical protein IC784_04160 [Acinetobacter seifertii]